MTEAEMVRGAPARTARIEACERSTIFWNNNDFRVSLTFQGSFTRKLLIVAGFIVPDVFTVYLSESS